MPSLDQNTIKYSDFSYLPIEVFKLRPLNYPFIPCRYFLSSGTTTSVRSKSPFSEAGLAQYKIASLAHFTKQIQARFGQKWPEIGGYSLIPNAAVWRDSSLAQMLEWISEISSLKFVERIPTGLSEKIWLFATASQIFNAIKTHPELHLKLPRGSVIFETGGLKNMEFHGSHADYFKMISHFFDVPESDIISEYGMCELASQAYIDVERKFRFCSELNLYVETDNGSIASSGTGCLIVKDPHRIDIPWPIRTQDIVELFSDQSFRYVGRVPAAELRGCSLRNLEIMQLREQAPIVQKPILPSRINRKILTPHDLTGTLKLFLNSGETIESLEKETNTSPHDAAFALKETAQSLPNSDAQWQDALTRSCAHQVVVGERLLLIAPQSHSLAVLYPLCFASLLGKKIALRLPKLEAELPFLCSFIGFLRQNIPNLSLELLSHEFRLPAANRDFDEVFCFGSDETIREIKEFLPKNVDIFSFGSRLAIGVIKGEKLENSCPAIVRDAFSLGQKGCRNIRALLLVGDQTPSEIQTFKTALETEFLTYWGASFPIGTNLALGHECIRYKMARSRPNLPVFPIVKYQTGLNWQKVFSKLQFVLPIVLVEEDQLTEATSSIPGLSEMVLDFGKCQRITWDGTLDGQPLFSGKKRG